MERISNLNLIKSKLEISKLKIGIENEQSSYKQQQ